MIIFPGAVLTSPVAVVSVPENQLFSVQQPQQVDSIQHEADLPNDEEVTGSTANVTDAHELTINVDISSSAAGLTEGGVPLVTEGAPGSSANDPKVSSIL